MIWLYNFLLFILLIPALPLIFVKSLTNRRLRYKLTERFLPKSVDIEDYILIHTSSFGETKAVLKFSEELKKTTGLKILFSVFTDTAYELVKNKNVILMPLDLYPLYKKLFRTKPKLAIFFETEIWPSYLKYLKKHKIPAILINGRMSKRSFDRYKKFSFFFKGIINSFNLIIAKSKEDAKRFAYFNKNTIVCGNIKKYKAKQTFENAKKDLRIETTKPILVLASFHKEEIDLSVSIIDAFKERFFIILAPRHLEDIETFESRLKSNRIKYTKRTDKKTSTNILLLNTMGELEKAYSIAEISIVGGSFDEKLKGHNPIEPLIYNNLTITGPYMESFKEETEELINKGIIYQLKKESDYLNQIEEIINKKRKIETEDFFIGLRYILDCYLVHTLKAFREI
ncbi:3-deoxy-D-manno-octulosonic acid transferase [Hippea alviniae]|uniref:3-deoxy-D-manno-octulosonic acid transferase n=1 Tax=Hippea alviniae TaxID=1279027 RepID=UPI0003B6BA4C|nr:glycosyltransferase N-terminal domain-containing protein [Hippea alviniae]